VLHTLWHDSYIFYIQMWHICRVSVAYTVTWLVYVLHTDLTCPAYMFYMQMWRVWRASVAYTVIWLVHVLHENVTRHPCMCCIQMWLDSCICFTYKYDMPRVYVLHKCEMTRVYVWDRILRIEMWHDSRVCVTHELAQYKRVYKESGTISCE